MKSNFYNPNLLIEIIESYWEGINSRKKILIKEFDTTRWRRGVALEMDEIAVSYPPKFWDKIKYLRPERTTKIPVWYEKIVKRIGFIARDSKSKQLLPKR